MGRKEGREARVRRRGSDTSHRGGLSPPCVHAAFGSRRLLDGWPGTLQLVAQRGLLRLLWHPLFPHFPAFTGACVHLGWNAEPQGFLLRFFSPSVLLISVSFCLFARHGVFCLDLHGIFRLGSILCFPSNYLCWLQISLLLPTSHLPRPLLFFFFLLSTNASPTDLHRVFHFLARLCLLRKSECDVLGTCLWSGVLGQERPGRVASFIRLGLDGEASAARSPFPPPGKGGSFPGNFPWGTNPRATWPLRGWEARTSSILGDPNKTMGKKEDDKNCDLF